jgi:Rad51
MFVVLAVAHVVTRTAPLQTGSDEAWAQVQLHLRNLRHALLAQLTCMSWMLTDHAVKQAIDALDTYILHNIVPQVRSGVDLYNDAGILRSTGSPRHVSNEPPAGCVRVVETATVADESYASRIVVLCSSSLDALLGGGYRQGQMVEFVGESGSGKTQVWFLA